MLCIKSDRASLVPEARGTHYFVAEDEETEDLVTTEDWKEWRKQNWKWVQKHRGIPVHDVSEKGKAGETMGVKSIAS